MNGQPLTGQAPDTTAAPLRLGTRRSALAMAQSGMVARDVTRLTGRPVELVEITTYGDTSREALAQIGGTGVFVSALRDALLEGRIDFAVHSLKDLPTAAPEGLLLAAVPEREDSRDALVAREGLTLGELVEKLAGAGRPARIGTGSPRRMAQLNAWARERGDRLETVAIRGNVDTRIGFVASGELDAVVLATAGLNRLGRSAEITEHLDPELMVPAPGQGALAIECTAADTGLAAALAALDHAPTRVAVAAERALLAALEAGCSAPVAALAGWDHRSELRLEGVVGTVDGADLLKMSAHGPIVLDETAEQQAVALGRALAARLLDAGAAALMGERAR
ncbi:hydroxymethylbilane synthase [Kitasatospora purpeofusca]|uniref:hydroxymethylbilane synthase n=1 Tax=Kitasatospora purpeofusca TaxID=67352 RepID=UPI00225836C8|nr:hydroxymethylbilane synthase [Kitasatospora purpeofusca]MCX4753501.1 hydroxymethylbilane synthase [Kitasatospora purpeofusca]WSR32997.1 hydroxymethylbilane synthase [Kitasatospora purpeofusca]WSR41066.1 hydroxymethylbilane synthase [Kitasatospora purpeofusca]